jgi:RNA polymerase sigma factor (sigma-70 family)
VENVDDLQIIELYFQRDEQAIWETDIKYGGLCRTIAYNILRNHQDAEECVNDTYAGVWKAIPPVRPGSLRAFVGRIARNLSLKRLEFMERKKRSVYILVSFEELADVLPDERYAPGTEDEDVGKLISIFLRSQKEEIRGIFVRRYYFFDSIDEIARRYACTRGKVRNRLYYTRKKLREYLIREGVEI